MNTAKQLLELARTLLIAHRGDSAVTPENSLPAFRSALAVGVDVVELDYCDTADGVPVVIHDDTLDRTTDARSRWGGKDLAVTERTMAELSMLDAGSWFSPSFCGTKLPTLAEALGIIGAEAITMVEAKAGAKPERLAELLEATGQVDRVVVQSFDHKYIERLRSLNPDVVLGALGEGSLSAEALNAIEPLGVQLVGWNALDVTAESVREVHARGKKVWTWTVNDLDLAQKLIAFGVDGLITNHPLRFRTELRIGPA